MAEQIERSVKRELLPPQVFLLSLAAQIPLIVLFWPPRPNAAELAIGLAMIGLGVASNLWADAAFKQSGVGVVPFSSTPRLMEDGPFRFTRNPMYLGMVLASAGVAVATGALVNLVFAAALLVWLHVAFVLPEELFLEARFGEDFSVYKRRIPRWLGWPFAMTPRGFGG